MTTENSQEVESGGMKTSVTSTGLTI